MSKPRGLGRGNGVKNPTILKFVKNTLRPAREFAADFEPIPPAELGDPPAKWTPESTELREWKYALEKCPAGMLRSTDRQTLIQWCEICAVTEKLWDQIRRDGMFTTNNYGNQVISPAAVQQERVFYRQQRLAAELGFTPAARSRIQVLPSSAAKAAVSKWEKLRDRTAEEKTDKAV